MKTGWQDSTITQNGVPLENTEEEQIAKNALDQTIGEVFVFPNPTAGNLKVAFSYDEPNADICVYNTLNQLVFQKEGMNKKILNIDFSKFNKGVYFIKVMGDDFQYMQKIIRH